MRKEAGLESDCKIDATSKAWTPLGPGFVFYTGRTEKKEILKIITFWVYQWIGKYFTKVLFETNRLIHVLMVIK